MTPANGNLLMARQYTSGPGTSEHGAAVATDSAGNIYIGGGTVGDGADALILAFNPAGQLLWKRTWDGPAFAPYSQDQAFEVIIHPDGNPVVLIYGVMASNHPDYIVNKYAAGNGAMLWSARWGSNGQDSPNNMAARRPGRRLRHRDRHLRDRPLQHDQAERSDRRAGLAGL